MRAVAVLGVVGAVLAACSGTPAGPVIIDQPGRVVVVHDPAPMTGGTDAASSDAPDATSDATDASVPDAEPLMCTGPATKGVPRSNCTPIGACKLSSCTNGEAYACAPDVGNAPAGYPEGNLNCVYSAADSPTGGQVHCCERVCVRHSPFDADCGSSRGTLCPSGMSAPVRCIAHPEFGVDAYCCP
jgi:hypothetical protein